MASLILAIAGCGNGAGAGASCTSQGDCAGSYQCLNQTCVPRCAKNSECGDGYQCSPNGLCNLVQSSIGDSCESEWDCGIGQGCVLDSSLIDGEQILQATCQAQGTGGNVGSNCKLDADCQNSLCTLGQCSQVCNVSEDCPQDNRCSLIPRVIALSPALFFGCLPDSGVIKHTIAMSEPSQNLNIAVPSDTHSIAIVSRVNDDLHLVGAKKVNAPSGLRLFSGNDSIEQLKNNRIRYIRHRRISTMLIPNSDSPEVELETGIYQVEMEATQPQPPFLPGTAIPEVTVFYKQDTSRILDLTFYFLNLEDHPCQNEFGLGPLNADKAEFQAVFQDEYLGEVERIFAQANIEIGTVRYEDKERADLDGIEGNDIGNLLQLADNETGIAVFFVRSLQPTGVQSLIGGVPGPPRMPGTTASGIAISADTLCYRSWKTLARVTAHSLATQMGLWNNREPGILEPIVFDPITDTPEDPLGGTDNLMFFGEFGGTDLSPGQVNVLGRYPGLR